MATTWVHGAQRRKLVATTVVSLDGVLLGPDAMTAGPTGLPSAGWPDPRGLAAVSRLMGARVGRFGCVLMGRRTYDALASVPRAAADGVLADLDVYVASRGTPAGSPGPLAARWLGPDAIEAVTALKRDARGDIILLGSRGLARSLRAAELIDEHALLIHPVVLSRGRHLFDEGDVLRGMRLVSSMRRHRATSS